MADGGEHGGLRLIRPLRPALLDARQPPQADAGGEREERGEQEIRRVAGEGADRDRDDGDAAGKRQSRRGDALAGGDAPRGGRDRGRSRFGGRGFGHVSSRRPEAAMSRDNLKS
jgi:hypothetical protein